MHSKWLLCRTTHLMLRKQNILPLDLYVHFLEALLREVGHQYLVVKTSKVNLLSGTKKSVQCTSFLPWHVNFYPVIWKPLVIFFCSSIVVWYFIVRALIYSKVYHYTDRKCYTNWMTDGFTKTNVTNNLCKSAKQSLAIKDEEQLSSISFL